MTNAPKMYVVHMTANEVQLVAAGLGKLPYESVSGLFARLQAQLTEQDKPKEAKS